jgi:hypothetical protein
MQANTGVPSSPLSRREFDAWLEAWYRDTDDATVGDVGGYGQRALLWVNDEGLLYRLNADTKRNGVRDYLALREQYGPRLDWSVVANRKGVTNKAAFGRMQVRIRGFYLYLA